MYINVTGVVCLCVLILNNSDKIVALNEPGCSLCIITSYYSDDLLNFIYIINYLNKQKRSTEGCSKLKSPETRQVQERLVSTLEHMQVPKWDRTRCPGE